MRSKMEIKVWRAPSGVFLNIGPTQIKLTEDQYAILRQQMFLEPANDVVWQSCVTTEMVPDPEDCGELIDELDEAVERTFDDLVPEEL